MLKTLVTHFASDVAPRCDRCGGTIWSYEIIGDAWYARATCVGCHAVDIIARKLCSLPRNSAEMRAEHETMVRAVNPRRMERE